MFTLIVAHMNFPGKINFLISECAKITDKGNISRQAIDMLYIRLSYQITIKLLPRKKLCQIQQILCNFNGFDSI